MPKKKKQKPKKKTQKNNANSKKSSPVKEKEKKFLVPSVTLPPGTIKERFTETSKVQCPPFEVHSYKIPSALAAYERQCRFGPNQQLPLILHAICTCLADEFEQIEKNFQLDEKLLQKERPFVPVRTPDLPPQLAGQLRQLTFGLFGTNNAKWVDIILSIPGMKNILFDMDLQTTSVRECENPEELLPSFSIDRSMHHFGYIVCYINRRIVEMQHSTYSPIAARRLVELNTDRKTRFCLNCMLAEFLIELYTKDNFKKLFLEKDVLPCLFMDIVDVPSLTDKIFDFFFTLSSTAWYESSESMVYNAFNFLFLPWIDGVLHLQTESAEIDADLQTLLWHVMSNQHFFRMLQETFIEHPLIIELKEALGENADSEFGIDVRERIFQKVGEFRDEKKKTEGAKSSEGA